MTVTQKVTIHERSGGLRYEWWMVVHALPREGNPDPVDDWLTINSGYGVNYAPLDMDPHLDSREVALKEHDHVRIREVNFLLDANVKQSGILRSKCFKQIYLRVRGQHRINCLCFQ